MRKPFHPDHQPERKKESDTERTYRSFVQKMFEKAVDEMASDIHIEAYSSGRYRIRMRIDGLLYEMGMIDHHQYRGILNCIKIMADMDITHQRLPQDGSFFIMIASRQIDVRISVIPGTAGEKMVLRIFDAERFLIPIHELGMTEKEEKAVTGMLRRLNGLILTTGATGSGKTTTLYSILEELNDQHLNIMTIENPPEYQIYGINQIAVTDQIDFEKGLRAVLRQDPDIIMLGEIRDEQTAQTAVRAAITGHLVLSTLHTNDALSAVNRLLDMQVKPYLLAACLRGVLSQRLVRKLCPLCREQYQPDNNECHFFGASAGSVFYRAKGCQHCRGTGYFGRKGIFEVLSVNETMRQSIREGKKSNDLYTLAEKGGMTFFNQAVCREVKNGTIDVREGLRVMNDGFTENF